MPDRASAHLSALHLVISSQALALGADSSSSLRQQIIRILIDRRGRWAHYAVTESVSLAIKPVMAVQCILPCAPCRAMIQHCGTAHMHPLRSVVQGCSAHG